MEKPSIESFFKEIADVPSSELSKIKKIFHPKILKKNSYFIKAGEIPDKVGFNISGLFRYSYIDKDGKEYTKHFCLENNLIISYSASLLQEESKFYIEALEDSEILTANYKEFLKILESHPCWDRIARKLIEKIYIIKEKREYQLLMEDAETRYKQFLKDYPGLVGRVKHYHIASYLGISPVSLSRIRNKVTILNPC